MKISIITVTFNSEETLEDTITSVADQVYNDVEHIVIDGGSSDGTLEILDKYKDKLSKIVSEEDDGIYDAMNKGIGLATGEVIGFLNSDDFFSGTEVLSSIAKAFQDPQVQACHADLVYVDSDDPGKVVRYWKSQEYKAGLFEKGWMPAHPTFYVRSSVYRQYGIFDTQYKFHSDMELTARFFIKGEIKTLYLPEVWVKMRTGGTTNKTIKNIIRGNMESYRACKNLGLKLTPFYFFTKFVMRIPQFFQRPEL